MLYRADDRDCAIGGRCSHAGGPLAEGTVITIEPILALGSADVRAGDDGWTVLTADGSASVHAEHTLVVSGTRPLVLTAAG